MREMNFSSVSIDATASIVALCIHPAYPQVQHLTIYGVHPAGSFLRIQGIIHLHTRPIARVYVPYIYTCIQPRSLKSKMPGDGGRWQIKMFLSTTTSTSRTMYGDDLG